MAGGTAGFVGAMEALEDVGEIFRWDGGTGVFHHEEDAAVFARGADAQGSSGVIVLQRVGEEVGDDLCEAFGIALEGCWLEVRVKGDRAIGCEWGDEFEGFACDGCEVAGFPVEGLLTAVELGEVEQGFDEAAHALGCALGGLQRLTVFGDGTIAAESELGLCEDDSERRAQLMGCVRSEAGLLGEGGVEAREGGVEDGREPFQFALGVSGVDAQGEVTAGDFFRGGADLREGPECARGKPPAPEEAEQEDRAAGRTEQGPEIAELVLLGVDGASDEHAVDGCGEEECLAVGAAGADCGGLGIRAGKVRGGVGGTCEEFRPAHPHGEVMAVVVIEEGGLRGGEAQFGVRAFLAAAVGAFAQGVEEEADSALEFLVDGAHLAAAFEFESGESEADKEGGEEDAIPDLEAPVDGLGEPDHASMR